MKRVGTLHILHVNHDEPGESKYTVGFSDYTSRQSTVTQPEIISEDALRKLLTEQIKIHPDAVSVAMQQLKTNGSADIFHTSLTEEELSTLGLK